MIEISTQVEISGGGRRVRGKATEQRANSYLKSNDGLRGALSRVSERAVENAITALRGTREDAPRVFFVGSRANSPNAARYDFRLSDGSLFACLVNPATGEVWNLYSAISPAELAEVCRLIVEERERSAAASKRRASRRGESVS